jgi:hypothetical protein
LYNLAYFDHFVLGFLVRNVFGCAFLFGNAFLELFALFFVFVFSDGIFLLIIGHFFHVFDIGLFSTFFSDIRDFLVIGDFGGFIFGDIIAFLNIFALLSGVFFVSLFTFGPNLASLFVNIVFVLPTIFLLSAFFDLFANLFGIRFFDPLFVLDGLGFGNLNAITFFDVSAHFFLLCNQLGFLTTYFLVDTDGFVGWFGSSLLDLAANFSVFQDLFVDLYVHAFAVLNTGLHRMSFNTDFSVCRLVFSFQAFSSAFDTAFGRSIKSASVTSS